MLVIWLLGIPSPTFSLSLVALIYDPQAIYSGTQEPMHMRLPSILTLLALIFLVTGCGEEITVVESGTYEGTITEVNAGEEEIYVEVPGEGVLELYFTDETTLTQGGTTVPFDNLAADQSVRVQVEKVGQRLDPVTVEILE